MGRKEFQFLHHLATSRTKHLICGAMIGLGFPVNGSLLIWSKSIELFSQVSQARSQTGAEKAIVTNLDETLWENVLQKTADEFFGR